jgi:hypothetical protein
MLDPEETVELAQIAEKIILSGLGVLCGSFFVRRQRWPEGGFHVQKGTPDAPGDIVPLDVDGRGTMDR